MIVDTAQLTGDASRRQHEIHATGGDCAARHAFILRCFFLLGKSDAGLRLDRLQPERSVGPGA